MSNKTPSNVGLKDSAELRINPATEDAQVAGNTSLDAIEADIDAVRSQTDQLTFVGDALKVEATMTTGGVTDSDDNSITAGQSGVLLNLDLLYGYNGATWERLFSNSNRLIVDGSQVTQPVSGTVTTTPTTSTATSVTSVTRTAVNTTLLASNVSRKGATIYNDSAGNMFVKLGTTASSTSFTIRLSSQEYYEIPFNYTGIIDGIWASAGAGDARITELT